YLNFSETVMKRFEKYVHYWIPFNEMNMTMHIPFIGAGLTFSSDENRLEKKYQAAHHQLLANSKTIEIGRKMNPNYQFGCMMAAGKTYALTSRPEDVFAAFVSEKNNFFFSDVQVKGTYPKTMKKYFANNDIHLKTEEEDFEVLKQNTVDFLSFSYYASAFSAAIDQDVEMVKTNVLVTIKSRYLPNINRVWQVDTI